MKSNMSSDKKFMISVLRICLLFISLASTAKAENATSYSYTPGAKDGPEHWGELNEKWRTCGSGQAQSPIDISRQLVQEEPYLGKLVKSYWPTRATLKRRHHDVELKWKKDAGNILINYTQYDLHQLHWHSPSEHTINGIRYELEMHMVHKSRDNRTAVIAVLYEYGHHDHFIAKLEPYIRSMVVTKNKDESIGMVHTGYAKGFGTKYYRYEGSLTTPPCTEKVIWTIPKKVRTVSRQQLQLLKEAVDMKDNARPLQNINNRVVGLYRQQKFNSFLRLP